MFPPPPTVAVFTLGVAVQVRVVGVVAYVYPPAEVTDPTVFVTTISTAPAEWAGVTTTNWVEVLLEIVAAVPSNVTSVVESKLVPEIVTLLPPAIGPAEGVIELMVGSAILEFTAVAVAEEVLDALPAVFETVITTLMYLPTSAAESTMVLLVAPEIFE